MSGWSELPYDVLVVIANKLLDIPDFLSFSFVCRHWNTVYAKKEWNCSKASPWLMLHQTNVAATRKFFSLSSFKCYSLPVQQPHNCRFWGTSRGWIAMSSEHFGLHLLNPITRVCIGLPSVRNVIGPYYYDWLSAVQKAAVFNLHGKTTTIIIGGYNRVLAFTRHGDGYWAKVKFPTMVSLSDVVCFNHQILAVMTNGMLMHVDVKEPGGPKASFAASPPEGERGWSNLYLAESLNRLLLVLHRAGRCREEFKVYELDVSKGRWSVVDDLGGQALLVDDYNCTSVSANAYFRHNCIYHVSDNLDYRSQQTWISAYDIKDGTSESVWICKHSLIYSCPLWIVPALW